MMWRRGINIFIFKNYECREIKVSPSTHQTIKRGMGEENGNKLLNVVKNTHMLGRE